MYIYSIYSMFKAQNVLDFVYNIKYVYNKKIYKKNSTVLGKCFQQNSIKNIYFKTVFVKQINL